MKILNTNKRRYPKQKKIAYTASSQDVDYVEIITVLTEGEIGDFAVYIGEGSPEWVASFGNKLSYKEAICHFSHIPEEKYRR